MVWILSHELVSGQQSAEDEVSREMQLFPALQVKLLGSFGSTAVHDVPSRRRRSGNLGGFDGSNAGVAETTHAAIKSRWTLQGFEKNMMWYVLASSRCRRSSNSSKQMYVGQI